jgi:2-keto-3-deoxy-6-phosphogluconate aldolase
MRELGYSKRQARAIVDHGFKALDCANPDDASDDVVSLLQRALANLMIGRETP